MATITKTIGSTSTIDTETPSTCSGSDPYTVTFVTDPTGVEVGDKAYITDESSYYDTFIYNVTGISGSSYTLEYVSGGYGAESPCSLYNAWFEQAPAVFKRGYDYESPRDWVADFSNSSVYSSGDDAVGEIQVNEKYDQGISSTTSGAIALNSARLTVHSSVRHDGTAGSGAGFKYTSQSSSGGGASLGQVVSLQSDNFTLEWLEFDGTGAASGAVANAFVTDRGTARNNNTVKNCLMYGLDYKGGGFVSYLIRMTTSTATSDSGHKNYIMNNIVYDNTPSTPSGGDAVGIYAHAGRSVNPIYVYNNTVHDITARTSSHTAYGIKSNAYGVITNNIVTDVSGGSSNDCFVGSGSWHADTDYNLATDSTAPGSNSVNSATLANIYESATGTVNLHLKSGSPAIDAGTDLGTTPTGVNIDIDGRDRDAEGDTWDIGADEYVVNGIEVTPSAASFEAAGVSPTTVLGSIIASPTAATAEADATFSGVSLGSLSITPSAAQAIAEAVDPSVVIPALVVSPTAASATASATLSGASSGSLTISPAAASAVVASVTPSVSLGSVSVTASSAECTSAAVDPTVSLSSVTVAPSAAAFVADAISPTTIAGSLSVTPAAGSVIAVAVDPTVVIPSTAITPAAAALTATASGTAVQGSLSLTPSASSAVATAVTPTVVKGSVTIAPNAAAATTSTRISGMILGSLTVVIPTSAEAVYAATDPTVLFGGTSVTPGIASFVATASATASEDSLTITPAASVVVTDVTNPTILAGVTATPAAAQVDLSCPPITLIITFDSASLGYWIDGRPDYKVGGNADFVIEGNADYETDGLCDYSVGGRPDYEIGDLL
jgi:hypothetical protein